MVKTGATILGTMVNSGLELEDRQMGGRARFTKIWAWSKQEPL